MNDRSTAGNGAAINGAAGATPLDRLDPRTRVLAALLFCFAVSFADTPAGLGAALTAAAAAAATARLPFAATLRRLAALEGCLALGLIALPFTMSGDAGSAGAGPAGAGPGDVGQAGAAFTVFGFAASWAGLERAAALATRAGAAALTVAALAGTLTPAALGAALAGLGVPDKAVQLYLYAHRYLDVTGREHRRLTTALRARGFRPGFNRHTWRTYGLLFGMLSLRSLERADRVSAAMRCRGFDGRFRSLNEARPFRLPDGAFAAVVLVVLLPAAAAAAGVW